MKSPEGRKIVHELIARADVFVLGFRPGVAERLGIDYDTLSKINPKLVYVHAAGYGAQGPYSHRPVYASTALALAGNLPRHAGFWMDPELSADFSVVELPERDRATAARPGRRRLECRASGVQPRSMFGLFHQRRTGEGQFLSTSMIGGNVYSYSDDAVTYDGKPPIALSDPEQYGLNALYRLYRTGDGWIFLAATNDKERAALEGSLGLDLPDGDDARAAVLAEVFADRKADEVEIELTDAGVGCATVFPDGHPAFIATDEAILAAGLAVDIEHPLFGTIRRHGLPALLSETPGRIAPGSLRGQHTESILRELGYSRRADRRARRPRRWSSARIDRVEFRPSEGYAIRRTNHVARGGSPDVRDHAAVSRVRRRQPLLRRRGRDHPPPRAVVRRRRQGGRRLPARHRRAPPQEDAGGARQRVRRARIAHVQGEPAAHRRSRGAREGRAELPADGAGVPEPREPSRGHGRAGPRSRDHVPVRCRRVGRGRVPRRPRRERGQRPCVQPLGAGRLGLRVQEPHLHSRERAAREHRRHGRGARPHARRRRAHGDAAAGPAQRPLTRRPVLRPVLGAHPGVGRARGRAPELHAATSAPVPSTATTRTRTTSTASTRSSGSPTGATVRSWRRSRR